MLDPAPTTKIAPHLARGTLERAIPATATQPEFVVLSFVNTNYQVHLVPAGRVHADATGTVIGTIRGRATRVDTVGGGGRYLEPVQGRPRRIQGRVLATDAKANTITIHAGVPLVCTLTDPRQKAGQFGRGDFVTCDLERGATFTAEA